MSNDPFASDSDSTAAGADLYGMSVMIMIDPGKIANHDASPEEINIREEIKALQREIKRYQTQIDYMMVTGSANAFAMGFLTIDAIEGNVKSIPRNPNLPLYAGSRDHHMRQLERNQKYLINSKRNMAATLYRLIREKRKRIEDLQQRLREVQKMGGPA